MFLKFYFTLLYPMGGRHDFLNQALLGQRCSVHWGMIQPDIYKDGRNLLLRHTCGNV